MGQLDYWREKDRDDKEQLMQISMNEKHEFFATLTAADAARDVCVLEAVFTAARPMAVTQDVADDVVKRFGQLPSWMVS